MNTWNNNNLSKNVSENTPKSPWANKMRKFGIIVMIIISVVGTAGGALWAFFAKPFFSDDGDNLLPGGAIGLGIGVVIGLIVMGLIMYFAELGINVRKVGENTQVKDTVNLSSADELAKYKTLLDSGAITEEEYNAKKKQLLGL